MAKVYVSWIVSAIVLIIIAIAIGQSSRKKWYGILLDTKGKVSLSQFQTVLWTILVLSLIVGVFVARLIDGVADPLAFEIPDQVLMVMGITYASTVLATAVKVGKGLAVRAKPALSQLWTVEEGARQDQDTDVTRLQNVALVVIGILAYIATVVAEFGPLTGASAVTKLPEFDPSWVTLLGISYGAYVVGKLPTRD
jgi:uncharacterized membrane protein YcfT